MTLTELIEHLIHLKTLYSEIQLGDFKVMVNAPVANIDCWIKPEYSQVNAEEFSCVIKGGIGA